MNENLHGNTSTEDWGDICSHIVAAVSDEVHVWRLRRDELGKIKTWELVYANPVALKSWGKEFAEVKGKITEEIFVGGDPVQQFMPIIEKIFKEQKSYSWEEYFTGTNQTLKMTSTPVGEYFISTGSDITATKETNRFISQAHKLNSLGAIAGGVVHDVNNIISIIQLNAESLHGIELDAEAKKRIQSILNSCDKASDLLGLILNFGANDEEITEINLNTKVKSVINIFRPSLKKNVEIVFEEYPGQPVILGNRIQICQILFNLASNAVRAMGEKGGVLSFSLTPVALSPTENFIKITIADSGCGMELQMLPHIFKPFYTRGSGGKGSGLGLSIVKTIVDRHHGFVTVDSKVGEGSSFHIHLPVLRA